MSDENLYYEPQDSQDPEPETKKPLTFEDIKSHSGKIASKIKENVHLPKIEGDPLTEYGNGVFKKLGGIIKSISFIIAFFTFAVSLVAALLLFTIDKFFLPFSIALLIFGAALSLIVMFLIYGLGQVICQNNEILRRLEKYGYHK